MGRLLGFVGATVGGSLGWWALSPFGVWAAAAGSLFGTAFGVYGANRLTRHLGG